MCTLPWILGVRELDGREHTADKHFGAVLELRDLQAGVRAIGAERRLVLGKRMAREIEAEDFFLHSEPFFLGKLGQEGQVDSGRRG